jgi:hypothetical protein
MSPRPGEQDRERLHPGDTLAYYNLKNFGAHHSGDIVDAPKGAAEFIDIARCPVG